MRVEDMKEVLTLTDSTTPKLLPFSTSDPASGSSTYTMSPSSACNVRMTHVTSGQVLRGCNSSEI